MADPVNSDVQRAFALINGPLTNVDDQSALVAGSRDGALRAKGQLCTIITSTTNASVVLPGIWNNEAPPLIVIVNESANTVRIGCSAPAGAGNSIDTMNGTATTQTMTAGFLALATKSSAICIASQSPFGTNGSSSISPNNWHASVLA